MSSQESTEKDPPLILVVDDDTDHLILVQRWLIQAGYLVDGASQGRQALARIERQRPDMVITDLVMNEMDGLALIEQIHRRDPLLPIIMVSGQADIAHAVEATRRGVVDFLVKPVERDTLLAQVVETLRLSSPGRSDEERFCTPWIHRSTTTSELLERARQAADNEAPVLITGPTGSGKQLLAECLHHASARADKPFVALRCGVLPERLLESELFGHVTGAFTGATEDHRGLLQTVRGGTLVLKDIDELPLSAQTRLLQTMEEMQVRPLGGDRAFPTDVRIIATTRVDLGEAVQNGQFREDLYYHLKVIPLQVPSLAERREDIPALAEHFLDELAREGETPKRFAPDALRLLIGADWPGNVRQLQNVVAHCQAMTPGDIIPETMAAEALEGLGTSPPTLDDARAAFERRYLSGLLRATNGNVTNAGRPQPHRVLQAAASSPAQAQGLPPNLT